MNPSKPNAKLKLMNIALRTPKTADNTRLEDYVRREILSTDLRIDPKMILAAHREIITMLNDSNIPYLVRKQGSEGTKSLRGKEEIMTGSTRKLVRTDNSPPIWVHQFILGLSQAGKFEDIGLHQAFEERLVPVAQCYKRLEADRNPEWPTLNQRFGQYPVIWTAGWKLSHIFPCSPQKQVGKDLLSDLLNKDPVNGQRIRCLRNLSPFNYFLSPMPRRHTMAIDGSRKDLGEVPEVISCIVHVLKNEIFAKYPEVQAAFEEFLGIAGLGQAFSSFSSDSKINVSLGKSTTHKTVKTADRPKVRKKVVPETKVDPTSNLPFAIYSVNQNRSGETYSGLLCAPDKPGHGYRNLEQIKMGDVILHKCQGQIEAISVVESFDQQDPRLKPYLPLIEGNVQSHPTYLTYSGKHLTMPDNPNVNFIAAFVRTIDSSKQFSPPSDHQTYMYRLSDKHSIEPELLDLIMKAHFTSMNVVDEDEEE